MCSDKGFHQNAKIYIVIMRKLFFLFISALFVSSAVAQDIILKRNGEKLSVFVYKIDDENVHYRFENESLEYEISRYKVKEILFSNGRKEIFSKS